MAGANIVNLSSGGKVKIINVGTVQMGYQTSLNYGTTFTKTIDIRSKVPNYAKLTKDNIIFGVNQANSKWRVYHDELTDWKWEGNANIDVTFTYTPSTGIITFTGKYTTTSGGNNCGYTATVYVVDGNVERV